MKELHTPQITDITEKYRRNWKEHIGRMSANKIPIKILQYQAKGKKKFIKIFEVNEGLCHVMLVTGLKRPNNGKDDDDDDDHLYHTHQHTVDLKDPHSTMPTAGH
jgi:hypothetical protein